MSLRRIAKAGSALMSGQGLNVISQLLLPPIFLHHYGVASYGEWLTLTATVSYLATLNFGLQTFANNQVAICYNGGEIEEANTLQATALLLLLLIVFGAMVLTLVVFLLPVDQWLGLKTSRPIVALTIYLLGLQILVKILWGFFAGTFLVVGVSYRGTNWSNVASLVTNLATAAVALRQVSFAWIAALQLFCLFVFFPLIIFDLRRKAPRIFPRMRYARPSRFGEILRPSGHFAMLFSANFLVYQLPVILMQRILGPATVVVFSLTRTLFSMSRNALTIVSQAMGAEITEMYGKRDWPRLLRLYVLSERVVFALVPVVSIGTLLAAPLLMTVWLHKRSLYDPYVCIAMALISAAMGIKEHKYTFQTSSNEHSVLARVTFWSYILMVVLTIPAIYAFGVLGFLGLWFITEVVQVLIILNVNERLFAKISKLDHSPVYKLFGLMGAATALGAWFAIGAVQRPLFLVTLIAILFIASLLAVSFPLFGLEEVLPARSVCHRPGKAGLTGHTNSGIAVAFIQQPGDFSGRSLRIRTLPLTQALRSRTLYYRDGNGSRPPAADLVGGNAHHLYS
jgi:O-antigen/teichoic acid export membrane protein